MQKQIKCCPKLSLWAQTDFSLHCLETQQSVKLNENFKGFFFSSSNEQQITDDGLITICRGCHRLQSLCVSGCANITDAFLHALGQNCLRLRYIYIPNFIGNLSIKHSHNLYQIIASFLFILPEYQKWLAALSLQMLALLHQQG